MDVLAIWDNLGELLEGLKQYEEAEQACRRGIEIDPQDSSFWNDLGVLQHSRQPDEAERAYRKAVELDPGNPYPWSNLGLLLERSHARHREAAEAALRAFEIDRARSWDLERTIRIGEQLADSPPDLPTALRLAGRAVKLAPDNTSAQVLLARVLTIAGKWPEAAPLLERLAANESVLFSQGVFQEAVKTGHTDEVIAILERTGADERWRPLYEALRAVHEGTPDYLRKVAPEVRSIATEILRKLAPDLFPAEK